MNDRKKAYDHTSSVTGSRDENADPATEHQDTASGNTRDRNEIDARRGEPGPHGPSTHQDTSIDDKGA